MRIHTDAVRFGDLGRAAVMAGERSGAPVSILNLREHGSRSHARSFDVTLTSDGTLSRRRVNPGSGAGKPRPYAATWDQWGWFLSHLYAVDSGMLVGSQGSPVYADADDFHEKTDGAYRLTDALV